ncbi:ROK family protein [Salipaludibacillus daqingensis]|uniref:ROK family protein n=1 Tax=Salipaludibacillus daqingensis TaxID=3041001 RepID=UPI0024736FCA|nr:ROK family protein [Salipaludibacillus daqingensis]
MQTLSVDFGGTLIKVGLIRNGEVIDFLHTKSLSINGLIPRLDAVIDLVEVLLKRNHLTIKDISGLGIAIPGLVDSEEKKVLATNAKYNDATTFSFNQWIEKEFNIPFIIENDARAALAGEVFHGVARGEKDAVMMIFGTGIGTSAMINGELLRGKHFQAGVLGGHITTDYRGYLCTCGNVGCVESQSSNWALPIVAKEREGFSKSMLNELDVVDYKNIVMSAQKGDTFCSDFLEDLIEQWATGMTNLIHAYDPSTIILSGGLMKSSDYLLPKMKERVLNRAWTPWGEPKFLVAKNPDYSVLLGLYDLTINSIKN